MARGVRLNPPRRFGPLLGGAHRGWAGVAALLFASALLASRIEPTALDWQPSLAFTQPWRAFTAAAVHYSALHLGANLAGSLLVAALGSVARLPARAAWAWLLAWPLTQFGLLLRPELQHYGGLSGVLHAGVAVAAVHLLSIGSGARRWIGGALLAGLLIKVLGESPWGATLRRPDGWDIAVAPLAHATGLAAGVFCSAVAERIGAAPAAG